MGIANYTISQVICPRWTTCREAILGLDTVQIACLIQEVSQITYSYIHICKIYHL